MAAVGALTLTWVSGCSVLYDLSTTQCSADADCVALGGVFESLVCVDNLCQEPPVTGCQSHAECMDQQGLGIQPWACIEQETEGSLRRESECVRLDTPECPTMLPQTQDLWRENLRSNNPVILGGSGVIGGTTFMDDILRNFDLALTELENSNGGLPSNRKVVMIGCQALFDEDEELDREMEHLANVVKVPGIVSTYLAADLQRAFNEYGKPAQMFFMSPLESDPTLAALQDDGLIWHIGPNFDVVARAYAPLLTRTLAHLGVSTGVKVATVVTTDSRLLSNMISTIQAPPAEYGLSFNGRSVTENRNDDNYLTINITSSETTSLSTQVNQILALLPHVIISAADTQFVQRMIPAIESGWPDGSPARPFYLLSPDNFNDDALLNVVQSNSSLVSRIAGVNAAAASDTRVYDDYVGRWETAFSDFADVRGTENFYDAAYYLIYAAAGAGQNLANGQSLLNGMNRLLSGAGPYDVGPDDMPAAMGTLAAGNATIQLNGTLGPPDWNRANGTRDAPGSIWCVDSSRTFRPDVLRYVTGPGNDPTQATLSGEFPCIARF